MYRTVPGGCEATRRVKQKHNNKTEPGLPVKISGLQTPI